MIRKVLACYFFLKISVPIRAQISANFFANLQNRPESDADGSEVTESLSFVIGFFLFPAIFPEAIFCWLLHRVEWRALLVSGKSSQFFSG